MDRPAKEKRGLEMRNAVPPSISHGSFKNTLVLWFLVISLLPLAVVSFFTYLHNHEKLKIFARDALMITAENKAEQIQIFFKAGLNNLLTEAQRKNLRAMADDFRLSFEAMGLEPAEFVKSPEWAMLAERFGEDMESFIRLYDYSDFFLIDFEGNVLYSDLQHKDLGSNVFTGKYAGTRFGQACQKAFQAEMPVFSDFERYEPSNYAPAAFMVTLIFGDNGEKLGMAAVQISSAIIDRIMQSRVGPWKEAETYLVGMDLRMRSNAVLDEEPTILGLPVETEQTRLWRDTHIERACPLVAEKENAFVYIGRRGTRVLGEHKNLEIAGTSLGIITEVPTSEAFEAATRQRDIAIFSLVPLSLIVIFLAFRLAGRITRPVERLTGWAGRVAAGELSQEHISAPENEIGDMSKSFGQVVVSLQEIADMCEAMAVGDLGKSVQIRSDKDSLGKAVNQMAESFRGVVKQAETISQGNYTVEVMPRSEKDALSIALNKMTKALRDMTEETQKRDWLKTGWNQLNEVMRGEKDFQLLGQDIISFLAKYLNASIGVLYLAGEDKRLKQIGTYAYDKENSAAKGFRFGEGLVGQSAEEKKNILITDVPEGFMRINSSMGAASPENRVYPGFSK